jgi:restriction endonuclease S subunit
MSDLPPGWIWATVGTVGESLVDGPFGSNLKTAHYQSSGIRVIRLQNIADGRFEDTDKAYIAEEHAKTLSRHEARPGDVLIAAMGDVLPRVCLVPSYIDWAIVKADCFRLRPRKGVLPEYLAYILSAPQTRKQASTEIAGVGRPRLNLRKVSALIIPVPPQVEQERIVAAIEEQFSCLDAGLVALRRAQNNMAKLMKSVIVSAIPDEYPERWKQVTIGEAGEVALGRQRSPKYHLGPNMRPYLRVANVFEDRIDTSDVMSMHFENDEFSRFLLRSGDILLNEGQSPHLLGRPAMYRGDPPNVAFTNSLLCFRARPYVLPSWALLVFRRHLHAKRFMRESQITTNIAHLSAGRFKNVEFPIPPIHEQESIVADVEEKLSAVSRMASEVDNQLRKAASLRSALLTSAFSGKLI